MANTVRDWAFYLTGIDQIQQQALTYSKNSGYGVNQANALEHTYTSAQLTRIYSTPLALIGGESLEWAGAVGRIGDPNLPNFLKDSYGDLWNNSIGREIGRLANSYGLSNGDVLNLAAIAIESGWTINNKLIDSRVPNQVFSALDQFRVNQQWGWLSGASTPDFDPTWFIETALQNGYSTAQILNAFRGQGYSLTSEGMIVDQRGSLVEPLASVKCFPAHTPIQTSLTSTTPISALRIGDIVLAFDPHTDDGRGGLVPRRVTRIYHNTTTEWVKLSWVEAGVERELVATPGHHFLDQFGNFPPIADMIRDGGATVVLASGELAEVVATRIVYSQATAHLFEQAQSNIAVSGNTALKPQMLAGWQTYNFEVEDLHTYVAECMSASQNDNFTIGKAAA